MEKKTFNYKILMMTTLIISGCSIIYEVLISSISSYLVGDSIKQFSITIGIYMCAMGLGSYISKYIKNHLFDYFVLVEILVGFIGGVSSILLFTSNIYLTSYDLVMYFQIILIGVLVGLEIPLLTRIIECNANNLRVTISTIFSFDYIGGLIGSIAFPLFLLPKLGYFATAFLVGTLNIVVSIIIITTYKEYIEKLKLLRILAYSTLFIMMCGTVFSDTIANNIEGKLYRDKIIFQEQTQYQKIVITKHKDDLRLFINGNIQFSTMDEYRYHESLVHIPMSAANKRENVLVIGGGDGLATREILKYDDVKQITLVDLDEKIVEICKTNEQIKKFNNDSLNSSKLKIINEDAYEFLKGTTDVYDVIIVDLPDPNDDSLNKLYTNVFYRLCSNALTESGVMSVQSTSPYFAKEAFWCINKTIEYEGLYPIPYHVEVPSFGDWGFQLVTKEKFDINNIDIEVETSFLNNESIGKIFAFSKDEKVNMEEISPNTLSKPILIDYYLKAVEEWR